MGNFFKRLFGKATDVVDSMFTEVSTSTEFDVEETIKNEVKQVDRLVQQVGQNAPDHVQVLVGSICQEIMSKVVSSMDCQAEVQRNIQDVDKYTDQIDQLTDRIDGLTDQIDQLTDKYQS